MSKVIIWSNWSCFIIPWKLILGHLVKSEKFLKLVCSHSLICLLFLLLLFLMAVSLVAQVLTMEVLALLKQFFSILYIIFILFLLSFLFLRRRRLWEFNVVLNDFVGEDNTLIWSANPRSFWLDFDWTHAKFFKNLLLKSWSNVRFLNMWKTKEQSCPDWSLER